MRQTPAILTATCALLVLFAASAAVAADTPKARELHLVDKAPRGAPPALFRGELEQPETLGVGRIARDVREHLPAVEALADYLDGRVADLGYARARPVLARDNAEMADLLRRGIVDIFSETPLSAVHLAETTGGTILLRERRKDRASYSSVIFVRRDSPVHALGDLRGKRIAFEDPGSTTAFLLPLAAVKSAGVRTVLLEDAMSPPVEDAVGYFFTLSESSIPTAVARRGVDAGALSDEEWRSLQDNLPDSATSLRIIHETERVPRAFVVTGPAVSPGQREGLRTLLLAMEDDDRGRKVLKDYGHVDGFDPIDAFLESQIDSLEATQSLLQEEMR